MALLAREGIAGSDGGDDGDLSVRDGGEVPIVVAGAAEEGVGVAIGAPEDDIAFGDDG